MRWDREAAAPAASRVIASNVKEPVSGHATPDGRVLVR
jgi:hypothetical protein